MFSSRESPVGRPPLPSRSSAYMSESPMASPTAMSPTSTSPLPSPSPHAHSPSKSSRLRESTTSIENPAVEAPSSPTASYLANLRSSRLGSRPIGSRPPPPSKFASLRRTETEATVSSARNEEVSPERPGLATSNSAPVVPGQRASFSRPVSGIASRSPFAGRAAVQQPQMPTRRESEDGGVAGEERVAKRSNGMGSTMRQAMQDLDLEDEKKVHSDAQDEAAELVYRHLNPGAMYKNPDSAYRNPESPGGEKKDSSGFVGERSPGRNQRPKAVPLQGARTSLDDGFQRPTVGLGSRTSSGSPPKVSTPPSALFTQKRRTPSGKSYGGLAEAVASDVANARRRSSSGGKRLPSAGKKVFMHPDDQIYEDPEERIQPPPQPEPAPVPAHVRKNPFARVRMQQERLERANSAPVVTTVAKHDRIEIQRNPPSQSRNAWYTANEPLPPTPPSTRYQAEDEVEPKTSPTPTKEGKEIRSDDLRAATSKQRKDCSPNLPRPTYVSDKPGRPIVSFKPDWQPREVVMEEMHSSPAASPEPVKAGRGTPTNSPFARQNIPRFEPPSSTSSPGPMPPIPTICLPDEPESPSRTLHEEPEVAGPGFQSQVQNPYFPPVPPTINVNQPPRPSPPRSHSTQPPPIIATPPRALPQQPNKHPQRPLPTPTPHHAATSPLPKTTTKSTPHFTPFSRASGALCASCALPIAGRVLSAAGERFHPACFKCHECATNLELVAFYPEPPVKRTERLERIQARANCEDIPIPEGKSAEDVINLEESDGYDSTLRFYCHLDFHELFSPRCKSCKTPIEGEVIVACGAEWHVGHFFCAQCGDPFDSSTPFVEKDQYAWCVGCHTHRYSTKCRGCRKPVTDVVVKALGSDWHGGCFCCLECGGEFQDGRYFLRGDSQDPVCVKCEERRLKA